MWNQYLTSIYSAGQDQTHNHLYPS